MTALLQQIRRTIRRYGLLPDGARVLVGLSGGSDSVALTLLLRELSAHGGFTLVAVAHLNHQLRPTAARDEDFCRALADRLDLRFIGDRIDVRGYATMQGLSLEDAARRLRYDFLARAAAGVGADRVAVGHTEDDQAETFLLKLIRGAGATGLGAIYPRRGEVVRPLLDVSRADLRTWLAAQGQQWVDDETNAELSNPRNRVRHVVLPELDRTAGGATRPALARAAALLREDALWLDAFSRERFDALVTSCADGLEIDPPRLAAEPSPVQRRVVHQALKRAAGGREIGLDHVEAVLAIAAGCAGGTDLPGCRVELRRGKLVLIRQTAAGQKGISCLP